MKVKVKKTSEVEFAGHPRRGSMYDGVLEQLKTLKVGESVLVPLGDMTKRDAHNRLSAALRRNGPKPPAGHKWAKRATKAGEMAIFAIPLKVTKKKTTKKAPAKKKVRKKTVKKTPRGTKKKTTKK